MNSYTVEAKRWKRGWELWVYDASGEEVGVTQSRTIREADRTVRSYVAMLRDEDPADVALDIRPVLDAGITAEVEKARREAREAAQAQERAAAHWRDLARQLQESGLTGSDIAAVLDVSPQRVSQLIKAS